MIVIWGGQQRAYRTGIDNLLVLLIGGIPIAMPTVLSVTMAIGSHRLSQQVAPLLTSLPEEKPSIQSSCHSPYNMCHFILKKYTTLLQRRN